MNILYNNNSFIAGYSADFNGSFHYAEQKDKENYLSIAKNFGLSCENMIRIRQNHTANVLVADSSNSGDGIIRDKSQENYDALITNTPNLLLCIVTADCVPVFLFDEKKKAVGIAHSGRAGTMQEIALKTVLKMQETFGSSPENIRCILGPYLCVKHHQVQEKDILGFFENFTKEELKSIVIPDGDRFLVDMGNAIKTSLMRAGIKKSSITDEKVCTYENAALFSWRRTHEPDPRILSFIGMLDKN